MTATSRFLKRSALLNGLFAIEGGSMFLLDVALAATLGLGAQSDILFAAWSLPQTIGRGMFQSLTNSFMGLFAKEQDPTLPFRQAITVIGLLSLVVAGLMALTARWWLPLSMLGAGSDAWRAGVAPAAVLAWLIALLGPAETFRAVYYRAERLVLPSVARIVGVATAILVILLAGQGGDLLLIAWSIVLGAAVEVLISLLGLYTSLGFRYRFAWPNPTTLREMIHVVGLPLLGQGLRVISGVAERALASFLGPGALTAVTFATRLITTLDRFAFRGFLVATIQTATAGGVTNHRARLRLITLLAIPIGVVLALLSPQLIAAAYGRGRFTADDAQVVALALQAYAPAVVGLAMTSVPLGLAYAHRRARGILGFFALTSLLLLVFEYGLITLGLDLRAFGIALTLSTFAALLWLGRVAGRGQHLWGQRDTGQFLALAALVLLGTLAVRTFAAPLITGPWSAWLELLIGGTAALLFTVAATWLLRLPEFDWIARLAGRPNQPVDA